MPAKVAGIARTAPAAIATRATATSALPSLTYPRLVVVVMRGPFLGKSCSGQCVLTASPHLMLEHGGMSYIGGGAV